MEESNPTGMVLDMVFKSAVLPLLVAGATAFLLGKFGPRSLASRRDVTAASGLLLGFAAGFFALNGLTEFPPILATNWPPYFALAALAIFVWIKPERFWFRFGGAVLLVGLCLWFNLRPLIENSWETGTAAMWLAGLGSVWIATLMIWPFALGEDQAEQPLFLVLCATAASLVAVMDGSVSVGQSAGTLASAAGGLFLVRLVLPDLRFGGTLHAVFLSAWGAMLLNAQFYVEVAPLAVALAAAMPFFALLMKLPRANDWPAWKRAALLLGTSVIPFVIAVVYLIQNQNKDYYY
ncbi:hypothetical protein SCOR_04220 [Sulfidibacter corallicola]|uniref:Uncharacterized protein n=1 Tax=Sulfidibacter corallicola TaxID=2818388 RepID=A0A8A4TZT7_SULCO|nr:hypothetical protein [Sulfidibacter corallicola]QTD52015.1 hypothetical protein J3U87_06040 [Sulfidibacter corallicola]